jgi:signal transduction histidine kinase
VIRCHQTPVAVVFSGQFLPDGEDARRQIVASIDKLAAESALPDQKQTALRESVRELKTRDEYVEPHVLEGGAHSPAASTAARKQKPTAQQLFLDQVREIERIALAQFEMHKRDRENAFRHQLRELFPALPVGSRQTIAGEIGPVMEIVRGFCGSEYLAFFISPQRYISYESSPHLLEPFLVAGIDEKIKSGIAHFNWRKAGLASPAQNGAEKKVAVDIAASKTVTQPEEVRRAIEKGLKSKDAAFFGNASILCQMYLSDAYRAVLIWGPFSRLTSGDLGMESRFLEEVSELVMTRVLSLAQLSDSEARTAAWENVAALLGHYSRRAMTPMSTGVRIIADYLESGGTYSKQDAQNACDSLEAASRFISQAVRAPLFSFAAMAEEVYKFAPASLEALVRDCVVLYHPMALERAVTVKIDPSLADLPKIEVDETKMRDAIGYVLDNAIKYSHHNKEVRINGELSGSAVRLSIEDFGLGMDEDELHLIFGRGYQGRRSRKAIHEEGEGMGLFHARLIIEAHKGKIWADCRSGQRSEASARLEGYRVRFTLELPIKQLDTSDKSN